MGNNSKQAYDEECIAFFSFLHLGCPREMLLTAESLKMWVLNKEHKCKVIQDFKY